VSQKEVPELDGDALAASESKASHIQIIASAGAGKTETISQRVAKLIRDGVSPSEIVAFTFTVKAAEEIKERIRERVRKFAGQDAADKIGLMYVGTIHGYCLQMLQQQVPEYETYDMADENQLAAFAIRWDRELNLRQFDASGNRLFEGMRTFLSNVAVLENDLISLDQLPGELESFKDSVEKLYGLLDQHRMLTFGMQIGRAIEALESPDTRERIASGLRHLIVDEYQDVNIAQEKLIQLLAKPIGSADLVVVGDDDQAIYQWRGSSVENITNFANRYDGVETYRLLTNYRSRPGIVALANAFSSTIEGRLPKVMQPSREVNGPSVDIADDFEFEAHEAHDIAESIQRLVRSGYKYSDIAVLVRAGTTYPRLLDAFEKTGIPVAPGDRLGLLEQSDALFLARVFAFFAEMDWKESKYAQAEPVLLADLLAHARDHYDAVEAELERFLIKTKSKVGQDSRRISLVELLYDLFSLLGIQNWSQDDNVAVGRLGTMAKFANMVGDYEGVQKHARLNEDGSQTGASDQKDWYFKSLVILMSQFARDSYRDFGGEDDLTVDAVDLMTVHAAKGLEWPIVFIPAVTGKRFPSSRVGQVSTWIIPRDLFDADRYEGTLNDERRLFYVALTRAREWVSISSHEKVKTQRGSKSPFMEHILEVFDDTPGYPPEWTKDRAGEIDGVLQISYSDLSSYLNCGWSYWLRNRIGFPSVIVEELGYGKAVHHLMRVIAEQSTEKGRPLNPREVDRILAKDFFLPFANKPLAENLKTSARKLIGRYMQEYAEDTARTWQTERPFELEVEGALIIGRADVILDKHEGVLNNLAIVDYKTSIGEQEFDLQLQIYAEAGFREGLNVRGAFVHDLKDATRMEVAIDEPSRKIAVQIAEKAVLGIKNREFQARPSTGKCGRCDVRAICRSAAKP
jgi:DNA helicase-2/ATP-dependent DNA helicase PcrA